MMKIFIKLNFFKGIFFSEEFRDDSIFFCIQPRAIRQFILALLLAFKQFRLTIMTNYFSL